MAFAAINPDYQVNIWTDNPSNVIMAAEAVDAAGASHHSRASAAGVSPFNLTAEHTHDGHAIRLSRNLYIRQIDDVLDALEGDGDLESKDDAKYADDVSVVRRSRRAWLWAAVSREMVGAFKNLAAAADILRVAILHRFGGIYMDTDTYPLYTSPEGSFTLNEATKLGQGPAPLYVDEKQELEEKGAVPGGHRTPALQPVRLGDIRPPHGIFVGAAATGQVLNNVIAVPQGSDIMAELLGRFEGAYSPGPPNQHVPFRLEDSWTEKRVPDESGGGDRETMTVAMTGPSMLADVLGGHGLTHGLNPIPELVFPQRVWFSGEQSWLPRGATWVEESPAALGDDGVATFGGRERLMANNRTHYRSSSIGRRPSLGFEVARRRWWSRLWRRCTSCRRRSS